MHVGLEDCSSGVYSLLEWCQLCVLKWLQQSLCGQSRGAGGCDTTGKQQVAVLSSLGLHERQHEAVGTMIVVVVILQGSSKWLCWAVWDCVRGSMRLQEL